jgi:hypothetical protein
MAVGDLRVLDAAVEAAVRRGGAFIACRPGCAGCYLDPFDIGPADARFLRAGLPTGLNEQP